MAKRCMVNREIKRAKLVNKYAAKRADLKRQARDQKSTPEQRMLAREALAKLPRNEPLPKSARRLRRQSARRTGGTPS